MKRRTIWLIAGIPVGLLLIGFVILYASRGWMLEKAFGRAQAKMEARGIHMQVEEKQVLGFTGVLMKGLHLADTSGVHIFSADELLAEIRFWPLLRRNIRLNRFKAKNLEMDVSEVRKALRSRAAKPERPSDTTAFGRMKRYFDLVKELSREIPAEMVLERAVFRYSDTVASVQAVFDMLNYRNRNVLARLSLATDTAFQQWLVEGQFNPSNFESDITITSENGPQMLLLPPLKQKITFDIGCRQAHIQIRDFNVQRNRLGIDVALDAEDGMVYHYRMAEDSVVLASAGGRLKLTATPDSIHLEPSEYHLNHIEGTLAGTYMTRPTKVVWTQLEVKNTAAQDFIASLPPVLFEKTSTMRLDGQMAFSMRATVDFDNKDSIHIEAQMPAQIQVVHFGEADLTKMNGTFVYEPYGSRRRLTVGGGPTHYPLSVISPSVRNAVLTREDPSFFHHKGIDERALESSLRRNLEEKRFVRGGSTISMQLIKNIFLSRQKTMARKIEELFLVWLMEHKKLVSKNRQLEVYMNIIEWGPEIYGVGEASQFYFSKSPEELNLNEGVFLSLLVPRPQRYSWVFAKDGNLVNWFANDMQRTVNIMARRGLVLPEDTVGYYPHVDITGRARGNIRVLQELDTLPPPQEDRVPFLDDWRFYEF